MYFIKNKTKLTTVIGIITKTAEKAMSTGVKVLPLFSYLDTVREVLTTNRHRQDVVTNSNDVPHHEW